MFILKAAEIGLFVWVALEIVTRLMCLCSPASSWWIGGWAVAATVAWFIWDRRRSVKVDQ